MNGLEIKKYFTLIELLVVVAIIGILASMLMPSLQSARAKAKASLCISNQSQLSKEIIMFSDDRDGLLPEYTPSGGNIGVGHNTRSFLTNGINWNSRKNLAQLWDSIDHMRSDSGLAAALYCPSQKVEGFSWQTYSSSGQFPISAGPYGWSQRVRTGYNYNLARISNSSKAPKYTSTSSFDEETVLLTDLFTQAVTLNSKGDIFSHSGINYFIFTKGDGSVNIKRKVVETLRTSDWQASADLNYVNSLLTD